jgi:SNF2 family DNA or RNA helicase
MVLNRVAVREYMDRSLKDSDKARRFSDGALDRKVAKYKYKFHTVPFRQQLIQFLLGIKYNGYVFLADMGLGKTKVALDLIRYRIQKGKVKKALVLVPSLSNIPTWTDEVWKHAPDLTACGIDLEGRKERLRLVQSDRYQIIVITYMGWLSLISSTSPKGKTIIIDGSAKKLESLFDLVIFDESTAFKNHRTLTFKFCKRLSRACRYKYALTGTPFDKCPQDLWSQFYCIDQGETLGETLGIYRAGFFREREDYFKGIVYEFDKRKKKLLARRLRNRSVRFTAKECLDLPEVVGGVESDNGVIRRRVVFPEENWVYYKKLLDEMQEAGKNRQLLENAYIRMRQLTAGFLVVTTEGEKEVVVFDKNPKLDALMDLIGEADPDSKLIVYNEYMRSGRLICNRLDEAGIGHTRIYSKTPNKAKALRQFQEDPATRVLVGSKSITFGLNLQVANYLFFFESPDSCIKRRQTERRIPRPGQTKHCFIYDIVVKGSVDEHILDAVVYGKSFFDQLMRGKVKLHHTTFIPKNDKKERCFRLGD